jgi:hypothetical protein
VTPVHVLCAAALHPGLAELSFFRSESDALAGWLGEALTDLRRWEAAPSTLTLIAGLPERWPDISPSLLSKVLQRKRPPLIPLLDRHVIDWYRPVTGERGAAAAWAPLLHAMRDEELDSKNRLCLSIISVGLAGELWPEVPPAEDRPGLSWLRIRDLAIWMGTR